jgi:hypothetical protein
MGKGYGPDYSKSTCSGLTHEQFDCFRLLIEKGYGPDYAKSTCR